MNRVFSKLAIAAGCATLVACGGSSDVSNDNAGLAVSGSAIAPITPAPTLVPATAVPPTAVPPTTAPPTSTPPTAVPPTMVPPTAVPPTAVPPTVEPSTLSCVSSPSEATVLQGFDTDSELSSLGTLDSDMYGDASYSIVSCAQIASGAALSLDLDLSSSAPSTLSSQLPVQVTLDSAIDVSNGSVSVDLLIPEAYEDDLNVYIQFNSAGGFSGSPFLLAPEEIGEWARYSWNGADREYPPELGQFDIGNVTGIEVILVTSGLDTSVDEPIIIDNLALATEDAQVILSLTSFEDGQSVQNTSSGEGTVTTVVTTTAENGITDGLRAVQSSFTGGSGPGDFSTAMIVDLDSLRDRVIPGEGAELLVDVFYTQATSGSYADITLVTNGNSFRQFNSVDFADANGTQATYAFNLDVENQADSNIAVNESIADQLAAGSDASIRFVINRATEETGTLVFDNIRLRVPETEGFALVVPDYSPAGDAAVYPNEDPDNTLYHYNGRVDFNAEGDPIFINAGTGVETMFTGTGVTVTMTELSEGISFDGYISESHYQVIVDGDIDASEIISIDDGETDSATFSGLDAGSHTLEIRRRNDSASGRATLDSIDVVGGVLEDPEINRPYNFEFYGDSVTTAQYSDLSVGVADTLGTTANDNNYVGYAAQTSRSFDADYHIISLSGIGLFAGLTQPTTMETLFDKQDSFAAQFQTGLVLEWDYRQYQADVVVVNLFTNDSLRAPDTPAEEIKQRYQSFLLELRARHPDACIFGVNGPYSLDAKWTNAIIEGVNEINAETSINNNDLFYSLIFESMSATSSAGDETTGHPREFRHDIMADELIARINATNCLAD